MTKSEILARAFDMASLAAVVQLTSTTDVETSFQAAEALIDQAAARGAELVVLPENVSFMGSEEDKQKLAEPLSGPSFARLGRKAHQHGIYLLAGSLPESCDDPQKAYNTSVLFDPQGSQIAAYRKIHLFDVAVGAGATHCESVAVEGGKEIVLTETPMGTIGQTICYDLRFPELFRSLTLKGAQLIVVPAAFTVPTGRDHWQALLRARAIENQCYILAAGQFGQNTPTRATYGRSMIIDPWGTILATCPDRPSIALAEIDLTLLRELRQKLPCLRNRKPGLYQID